MMRKKHPDRIDEFACHEGNYYMENMLRAHAMEDGMEAESR